jgi:pyruvate/2-oxoglutarate dehydrogenase complex dihydrolipoamide dehydrogenase (E3) component
LKNLPTFEDFINEKIQKGLSIGDVIATKKGMVTIISKEESNGKVLYRDNKGGIHDNDTLEEEAIMVGTGTSNPVSAADSNPTVNGYRNNTDSASGGSYPTYIG